MFWQPLETQIDVRPSRNQPLESEIARCGGADTGAGGLFVVEILSVIIQVGYFKTTGKRVFLMAPLHHHFEMMAWSETKIMLRFWIIAAVCSGIGFTLYQQSIGR